MANTKSAIKRIRRISRQTIVNKTRKSKFKNAIKKMNLLLDSKKKKEALAYLPKLNSEFSFGKKAKASFFLFESNNKFIFFYYILKFTFSSLINDCLS